MTEPLRDQYIRLLLCTREGRAGRQLGEGLPESYIWKLKAPFEVTWYNLLYFINEETKVRIAHRPAQGHTPCEDGTRTQS